jgi:predicted CopG family antitoxin
MGQTTIRIDDDTADALHNRKERGDTYDDVIQSLLEDNDS